MIACKYGNIHITKFLIQNGANIHARDDYAIRYSVEKNKYELFKYLLENDANIHAKDDYILKNIKSICSEKIFIKTLIKYRLNCFIHNELARRLLYGDDELLNFYYKNRQIHNE
jgi:hypothetical protein